MSFQLQHKETFTNQLRDIPVRFWPQILEKAETLRTEPRPDGRIRKKLKKYEGNICRIRSGNYRIIYTYGDGWVELLSVDDRADVYDEQVYVGSGVGKLGESEGLKPREFVFGGKRQEDRGEPLPRVIDESLLRRLSIQPALFPALIACKTVEDLLAAGVPDVVRDRLFDVIMDPNFDDILARPSFVTGETHNLVRYIEGEILGFLLALDEEQEALVDWGMKGTGPTLVKGGPGTGKSTIALYRVQAILKALKAAGVREPRILLTTYTNALVTFSEQLLERLLGDDARFVEVRTADSVVNGILSRLGLRADPANRPTLTALLYEALQTADFGRNDTGAATVRALGTDYLLQEIGGVIEAREVESLDDYLRAPRTGRRVPLNANQRAAVWQVYQALNRALDKKGLTTWHRKRRQAMQVIRAGAGPRKYDGVVIDEAQDLDPTVLRLLVGMCASPRHLFVTADANQSIYGSSFRWSDVHEDLRVQGRTQILRTNHRSTREIGEAAHSYLQSGELDATEGERAYLQSGPLPAFRAVSTAGEEVELLAEFLREAMRFWRLGLDSCAILTQTVEAGRELAFQLSEAGVAAEYMEGKALDLKKRVVKVITLRSSKGLEFPIVAVGGFVGRANAGPLGMSPEEREEHILVERRSMYVGMTRAMRALFVVGPLRMKNPLAAGFDPAFWNAGDAVAEIAG